MSDNKMEPDIAESGQMRRYAATTNLETVREDDYDAVNEPRITYR
ncbi:hypothetical protein [Paenibacillus sp. EKM212P]|nr:hypothetical protein [Paenibacillus sp. EKM212P]